MNFLLRPSQIAASDQQSSHEFSTVAQYMSKPSTTLEGPIAEDPYSQYSAAEDCDRETDGVGSENGGVAAGPSAKNDSPIIKNHLDVTDEEGWITIPYSEQVHILVCLSACKDDTEIITPFKVAAVMSKNGMGQSIKNQDRINGNEAASLSTNGEASPNGQDIDLNGENLLKEKTDPQKEIYASESLLRMEYYKRQTEMLLQKFKNSHFFVWIAKSDEPLWYSKILQNFL